MINSLDFVKIRFEKKIEERIPALCSPKFLFGLLRIRKVKEKAMNVGKQPAALFCAFEDKISFLKATFISV